MSSLLEQAIIDATALKEVALKNAEAAVIKKYSEEVRKALDVILEADGLDLGVPTDIPEEAMDMNMSDVSTTEEMFEEEEGLNLAATDDLGDGDDPRIKSEGDSAQLKIQLDTLQEALANLEKQLDEEEEIELEEEMYSFSDDGDMSYSEDGLDEAGLEDGEVTYTDDSTEDQTLDDSLYEAILEKLAVDMGASLSGWAGRSSESVKEEEMKEMARRRSTEVQEEMEELKKAQEELVFENKKLKQRISEFSGLLETARNNLEQTNVSNARLLYTNRVLRNSSLNERQKNKIVEEISKAGSVGEAKTIFDSLQSMVQSTPTRRPESLSEAINRPTSIIKASQREAEPADIYAERMKKLAGIN